MRITIIGDSFTHTYKDTWIETVCKEANLEMVNCYGFRGKSQYKIYENFLQQLVNPPDVFLICHTEYMRLYHEGISDKDFARISYSLMIQDMQLKCKKNNIKMINVPCFEHEFIEKFYGLWFLATGGLINISKADYPEWTDKMNDPRTNHFSPKGHCILANHLKTDIKNYVNGNNEFHIVSLYAEYFS